MSRQVLETNRLVLREFDVSDDSALFQLNGDPEVIKYTGDPPFESVKEARNFVLNYTHYQEHGFGRWAMIQKTEREFIGWCGLKYDPLINEVDIGFRIMKKYWGNGFSTEAAIACLDYGFSHLGLKKIVGRAMQANKASLRVLEKAGMQFVGEREFEKHAGVLFELSSNQLH